MSDDDRLMHHEYDGIKEYDNPLPFWWKGIFVISIAHAAAYFAWYHLGGPGETEGERYAAEVRELEAKRAAAPKAAMVVDEASLASMAEDSGLVERGHAVFAKNCASCHSDKGQGLVGPNLTDAFQIHGTTRLDLYTTIQNGVPEKGMLSWGPVLPPEELAAVTAFVTTLRGTDVPGGKAAEGRGVDKFQ
jgi:cytochrome c oxidase cbb3-type subunit 3